MKKSVTIIIILLVLTLITVASIFLKPLDFIKNIGFINKIYSNNTLTVNSPKGKAQIYINDKDYGQTNQKINDLAEGVYTVTLRRIVDDTNTSTNFYQDANFQLELNNNTESIIDVEIGPGGQLFGYMLYYSKLTSLEQDKSYLTIVSDEVDANISLDNEYVGTVPMNRYELKPSSYKLSAQADGFQGLELPIITRKGYNLNVFVYLFPIPTEEF
jgi:hypothetical protein